MPFIALEKRQRLKNGDCRLHKVAGQRVLLIQQQDRYYAIGDTCPHAGASLRKGRLHDDCIRCPKHGISFDLASGLPRGGEAVAAIAGLKRYEVRVRGDEVGIEVEIAVDINPSG